MNKLENNRLKNNIKKLLLIDSVGNIMIANASWVALLAVRGFSMVEIGFAECIFHIASMIFEIPSGAIADVFGRKKVIVASRIAIVLHSLMMITVNSFSLLAVAMVVAALSYNLASGTREALAYDSLKQSNMEEKYDKFAANDLTVYSFTSSLSTLLAGAAIYLGYALAYMIDIVIGIISVVIAFSLQEVETDLQKETKIKQRFVTVAKESIRFIKENKKMRVIILVNNVIGAVSVLILFFLQAKLPKMGLNNMILGPTLFGMGLGSTIGAKASEAFKKIFKKNNYRKSIVFSAICTMIAFSTVFIPNIIVVVLGGFIGAFADNYLEVLTDIKLNNMIESDQRATLISINSFVFSIIMIVLSPIFGTIFS